MFSRLSVLRYNRFIIPFFLIVAAAGLSALHLLRDHTYRTIMVRLTLWPGISPFGDWAALPDWLRCSRAGVDIYVKNACSIPFNYGPPLLLLPPLPGGPGWNAVFGIGLILAFAAALAALPAPRSTVELATRLGASLSCGTALALERGNIDVAIFVLLVLAVALAGRSGALRNGAYALVLAGAAAKFYPLAAFVLLLRERLPRFALACTALALAVAGYALFYRDELRLVFGHLPVALEYSLQFSANDLPTLLLGQSPGGSGSFDASLLDPGNTGRTDVPLLTARAGLTGLMALAAALLWRRHAPALDRIGRGAEFRFMAVFGAVSLFCFLTSQNFLYRGIFLLPVLPGLFAAARTEGARRTDLLATAGAVVFVLWITALNQFAAPLGLSPLLRLAYLAAWWLVATGLAVVAAHTALRSPALRSLGVLARTRTPRPRGLDPAQRPLTDQPALGESAIRLSIPASGSFDEAQPVRP